MNTSAPEQAQELVERHTSVAPPHSPDIPTSQRQTAESIKVVIEAPLRFSVLKKALMEPGDFIDMGQSESELLKQKMVAESIRGKEPEALFRAIARLKLMPRYLTTVGNPETYEQWINIIIQSDFFTQIKELLYLIQQRGETRINGFPYLIERACRHLYGEERKPYVGEQKHNGTVIRIDAANYTRRTYEEGERQSAAYFSEYFYEPFFKVLRSFPDIKFIRTIGDEIVCITEAGGDTAERFAKALSANLSQRYDMSAHIGIGRGEFSVTITPYGKILVTGKAWIGAKEAQKKSKKNVVSTGETRFIYVETPEGYSSIQPSVDTALPERPQESAMHLFRGVNRETIEEIFANPEKLMEEMLNQFTLAACTVPEGALSLENPIERRATCLCVKTPLSTEDTNTSWEKMLERIAAKYGGKVVDFELNPDEGAMGEKMGIIVFGTQGTNPFNQEEKAVRCAKQLYEDIEGCVIGMECGEVHISDTNKTNFLSDAINKAVRLAFADDSKRYQRKAQGDPEMGPIRIGPNAQKRFDQADITMKTLGLAHPKLSLKGYSQPQDTLTTRSQGLEIGTLEGKYVRNNVVDELLNKIESARRIHIAETEEGLGTERVLRQVATRLNNMAVVELPGHHDSYDSYEGISSILNRLFPTLEDFETWMEKQKTDEAQKRTWGNLYRALRNEVVDINILVANPDIANREIKRLLKSVGNLAILCPNIGTMHETSRILLEEAEITLITTGRQSTAECYKLNGVDIAEAMLIAKHKLELKAEEALPSGLKKFIETNLAREGLLNPVMVERLIDGLLGAQALRKRDCSFFDQSKANSEATVKASLYEYQDQYAVKVIDGLTPLQSAAIRIAVTLEPLFTEEQCKMVLDGRFPKKDLIEKGVLRESRGGQLQFVDPVLPARILAKNLLPFTSREGDNHLTRIETAIRKGVQRGTFNVPHYLRACERIGMSLSKPTIELTAQKTEEFLESDQVLAALAICEQFIATNHSRLTQERISDFDKESVENIFGIYFGLLEAKITVGKNAETDIAKIGELIVNTQAAIQANKIKKVLRPEEQSVRIVTISFDIMSRFMDMACKSAYRSKDMKLLAGRVEEYEKYADKHSEMETSIRLGLRRAQLRYVQADDKTASFEERRKNIEESIKDLTGTKSDCAENPKLLEERDTALYLAQGYKLVEKGLSDNNPRELETYITETQEFIKEQEDKGNKNKEWLAEIRRYLIRALVNLGGISFRAGNMEKGKFMMDLALQFSEINIKIASENGYLKLMAKSLNYLLNLRRESARGDPKEKLETLNSVAVEYERLEEVERGLPDDEKQEIAEEIVASILTILESINNQIEILKMHPDIPNREALLALAKKRGEETIAKLTDANLRYSNNEKVRNWQKTTDEFIAIFRESAI